MVGLALIINGLFVSKKRVHSFVVEALRGGKSMLNFSYRVVSRRRGLLKERVTSRTLITVTSSGGDSARSLQRWPQQE